MGVEIGRVDLDLIGVAVDRAGQVGDDVVAALAAQAVADLDRSRCRDRGIAAARDRQLVAGDQDRHPARPGHAHGVGRSVGVGLILRAGEQGAGQSEARRPSADRAQRLPAANPRILRRVRRIDRILEIEAGEIGIAGALIEQAELQLDVAEIGVVLQHALQRGDRLGQVARLARRLGDVEPLLGIVGVDDLAGTIGKAVPRRRSDQQPDRSRAAGGVPKTRKS